MSMQLAVLVPDEDWSAVTDDAQFHAVKKALGIDWASTFYGTQAYDGKRVVLAYSRSSLDMLEASIIEMQLPWEIVAAAKKQADYDEETGEEIPGSRWLRYPDMAALYNYLADIPDLDADGNVIGSHRPDPASLDPSKLHGYFTWPDL